MHNDNQLLRCVLDGLMGRYSERVPAVKKVTQALIKEGIIRSQDDIENDHIAFRTLGIPNLGISSLEKIFLSMGYERRDAYDFQHKKLNAYWYSPPADDLPRIFISELRVQDLSATAQNIIQKYTAHITTDPVEELDLQSCEAIDRFLHSSLWAAPSWEDYEVLQEESEYASWTIYNRYYLNHYTLSVHNLPDRLNTIEKFNAFLENLGIKLNDSGGKIKVSKDGLLKQSSTVAQMVEATFAGGQTQSISGSYVEFAERKVMPQYQSTSLAEIQRRHRRDGFETANADKIFESTYSTQTKK